jgi:hypothetical protein
MQRFQYQYGDKPLEGYTIQRGVGRGGFGEVYYAISDSGKQVALKTLQNYEQIELRGINQCMNLKSPYLVTIFDVKYNDEGRPFVIMEYVSGPSLADIIRETPGGLGPQKTAFFLREISKGLSYLHGCGIVHRDLKPGNIFYEDGRVKIGDYGLSKSMNTSVHSGQTVTVGTVHYMAPEIGAGCYNRSIDIYAMGVVVYEMLTGQVPFFGNSPAEVLMKHMSSQPDLAGIDETFARMIRKAMAKDPAERYATVQEMVEDVFGAEHIRNSVSQFRPESLSIIAENLAKKITPQPGQAPMPGETPGTGSRPASAAKPAGAAELRPEMVNDPVTSKQRNILAILAAAMVAVGTATLGRTHLSTMMAVPLIMATIYVSSKLILVARWKWLTNLEDESGWLRRLVIAAFAVVPITVLLNPMMEKGGTWMAIALGLLLTDWWKLTDTNRDKRVSLGHAFGTGLIGFIAAGIFTGNEAMAAGVLAGVCLVTQIWSPFVMTSTAQAAFQKAQGITDPVKRAAAMAAQAVNAANGNPAAEAGQAIHEAFNNAFNRPAPAAYPTPSSAPQSTERIVPGFVRFLWLIGFILLVAIGIGFIVMAGKRGHEPFVGFGVAMIWLGLLSFIRAFTSHFTGWYDYLIRPLIMSACLMGCISGAVMLGNAQGDGLFVFMFMMVACGLGFIVCFIPMSVFAGPKTSAQYPQPQTPSHLYGKQAVSPYKRVLALVLSGAMLFGFCGLHRFYVGKIGTGVLWLLTGGLLGIGQLIDILMIVFGGFRDKNGRKVLMWESEEEMKDILQSQPDLTIAAAQPVAAPAPAVYAQPAEPARSPAAQAQAAPAMPHAGLSAAPRHSIAELPFSIVRGLFGVIAFLLGLAAVLVGLATVLHLPQIVAGGFPNPEIGRQMETQFGRPDWAPTVEQAGFAIFTILLVASTTVTLFVRRHDGAIHILRAMAGNFGLWVVFRLLNDALPVLDANMLNGVLKGQPFGPIVESLLNPTEPMVLTVAVVVFLASMAVLAWPPRKKVVAAFPQAYGV